METVTKPYSIGSSIKANPFCGVGKSFSTRDFDEALRECQLDFTVSQHQNLILDKDASWEFGQTEDGRPCIILNKESNYNGIMIPEQRPLVRDDTLEGLITLGHGYEILQNRDCAGIIEDILKEDEKIEIVHGGSFKNCERCFLVARLPEPIKVGHDRIEKYVIINWSHTGRAALTIRFSPMLKTGKNGGIFLDTFSGKNQHEFKIRHTKQGPKRLKEATNILQKAYSYFNEMKNVFARLKETPFDNDAMMKYLNYIMPNNDPDEEGKTRRSVNETRREKVKSIYDGDGNDTEKSAFDAYASICAYTDVVATGRKSKKGLTGDPKNSESDMRLDNIWFGTGAKMKANAFKALTDHSFVTF